MEIAITTEVSLALLSLQDNPHNNKYQIAKIVNDYMKHEQMQVNSRMYVLV